MGGLLILGCFVISTLLWVPLSNPYLWPVLLVTVTFGIIGGIDDWLKLKKRSSAGMSSRQKLLFQTGAALLAVLVFIELSPDELRYGLALPFIKNSLLYLGIFARVSGRPI